MRKNLIFIYLSAVFLLNGCTSILPTPHKIDIQQGNRVKPEKLQKLQIGMSRKQVKYILGTPLLEDTFHSNRWDYIYYFKAGSGEVKQSRVSLFFDGDSLTEIDRNQYHPEQQVNTLDKDKDEVQQDDVMPGGGGHSH